ncbi:MAG: metallophosphoesterase family protein [Planctomycetes bacterium]|nr:metallophosphoesterase family protein [Planctomycetota bacterium]
MLKKPSLLATLAVLAVAAAAAALGVVTAPKTLNAEQPAGVVLGEKAPEGATPAQWRVIWTSNPATSATVSWTTATRTRDNLLLLDTQPRGGKAAEYAVKQAATESYQYTGSDELWVHHVRLADLKPATKYYFATASDGRASREFYFTTAPEDDVPVRFLYGGDSRSDRDARRLMNRRIRTLAEEDPGLLCFVHGGDYVHDGDKMDQWTEWMTDHELTICADGRVLPIVPTRGNHESGDVQLDQVFDNPGGKGLNYFATRLSSQVLLVTLDTEISAGGEQAEFLRRTLKDNAKCRWQLANYHRPAYPAVKEPSVAKQHWVPIFEEFNLDCALESDGHTIKRTCAIRADKPADDGVVYIGEGGLGVKQRTPENDRWYFKDGVTGANHHVQRVTADKDSLKVETILHNGKVFDTWQRSPRKR